MAALDKTHQAQPKRFDVRAVTQAIPFPPGLYRLAVRTASPMPDPETNNIPFPALLVATAPGSPAGVVEFVSSPTLQSVWLYNPGDTSIVRIAPGGATLIFSSLRTEGAQTLDIRVDRVELPAQGDPASPAARAPSLKLQLDLYMRREGELHFVSADWAGRTGAGSWIEAIAIVPLEVIGADDIEYKGLSANGFETPWISDGAACGTKGAATPLVGFAVRLKPAVAAQFDCEYSARFRSGALVGPLRNGAPCRSQTAGDPIEAIQVRVLPRAQAPAAIAPKASAQPAIVVPSFGRFREDDETADDAPAKPRRPGARKPAAAAAAPSGNADKIPAAKSARGVVKRVGKR